MSNHASLTETPPPDLDWTRDEAPASGAFDDIYFSVDGGLEETKAVFLDGCDLPERWKDKQVFVIGELGFGTGLNFLAAWKLWLETAHPSSHLHFISIEAYPWERDHLQRALEQFPSLKAYSAQLLAQWPGRVPGVHRLHFGNVTLTLFHMSVQKALASMDAKIDAWFLDGFSPSKNPDMWSQEVFNRLYKLSAPAARVATFTVAGHVRRGLSEAGFTAEKKPGFGRKRERLEAYKPAGVPPCQPLAKSAIIIGGGIAGASIARSLGARGVETIIIDKETDLQTAASGNPLAMITPRLDIQDRPESRFYLSAFLYACARYRDGGHLTSSGIIHCAKSDQEAARFGKIVDNKPLPPNQIKWIAPHAGSELTGHSLTDEFGSLYFSNAGTISPKDVISLWTGKAKQLNKKAVRTDFTSGKWRVYSGESKEIAAADLLFVCAGANIQSLVSLDVRFTRGQISWGETGNTPKIPINFGNYVAPYPGGALVGATHQHVNADHVLEVNADDQRENIGAFKKIANVSINEETWQSRAAIRVTTKDTMPIAQKMGQGLYILSGLGARGFMMAPLLGEYLVSEALGEPSPLCTETKMRFGAREKPDPKRTRRP